MGACLEVTCPKCAEKFVVSPSLVMSTEHDLHCPFCDLNFPAKDAAKIWGQMPPGYSAQAKG